MFILDGMLLLWIQNAHKIYDCNNNLYKNYISPISIGDYTWIGMKSIVLKGTIIPNHTIISAGAIVKGIFNKEYTILSGNPAVKVAEGYTITDDF